MKFRQTSLPTKRVEQSAGPTRRGSSKRRRRRSSPTRRLPRIVWITTGSTRFGVQPQVGCSGAQRKSVDFSKVISMIEEMVTLLNAEQGDDCNKKGYCLQTEDDAKALAMSTMGYKDDTQEF